MKSDEESGGWRRSFIGRVFALTAGAAAGQAINVASIPITSRLFSVEDFAVWACLSAYCSLLAPATCLGFDTQIPRTIDEPEARSLAMFSFSLLIGSSVALAAVFPPIALIVYPDVQVLSHWWVAPLAFALLVALGSASISRFFLVATARYHVLSMTSLAQNAFRSVLQLSLGFFSFGWLGLAWAELVGRSVGASLGFSGIAKAAWPFELHLPPPVYRRPARLAGLSALLDSATAQLPIVLLGILFDLKAVGSFSFVQRALVLPITLIGISVADVVHGSFLKRTAESGTYTNRFMWLTGGLFAIALPGAIVLAMGGPTLFSFLFGASWAEAGDMARYMAPWFLFEFAVSPMTRLVHVTDRQDIKLIYNMLAMLSLALATGVAAHFDGGAIVFVASLSIARSVAYIILLTQLLFLVRSLDSSHSAFGVRHAK